MRTYAQFCGLAKALDVVGDRWTLLIVRELLLNDSARYSDLLDGLPGIATNLLADRLSELEAAGIVTRDAAPRRKSTTLRLTPRGRALEPVIAALGAWAAPLLDVPKPGDVTRGRWLVLPLRLYFEDGDRKGAKARIELRLDGDAVTVTLEKGRLLAAPGAADEPDLIIEGPVASALPLLAGRLSSAQARRSGFRIDGNARLLKRIRRRDAALTRSEAP